MSRIVAMKLRELVASLQRLWRRLRDVPAPRPDQARRHEVARKEFWSELRAGQRAAAEAGAARDTPER